ncbi:transmembrane protein 177 isoform X2 [Procambarus clarkii]
MSWAVSPSGRRVVRVLSIAGAAGSFLVYYLPNTYLLNTYKNVTKLYRKGIEVPVSKQITSLVKEVMDDLQLTDLQRKSISTYTSYGFDLFHAGSTSVKTGGILGIPINFSFSSDNFDRQGIAVNNEPVPWSTAAGESLKQSIILSKDAKKFGIAREITSLSTVQPFVNGAFTAAIVGMVYTMSSTVNANFNLYARPRSLRMVWYVLVYSFGGILWALCKDVSTVGYEGDVDKAVADISNTYAAGGLEFYEKVLQRNVALRSLMGVNGEAIYTAYGNDQVLLRTKHLPFTVRRDYMKTRVEEYCQSKEEPRAVGGMQNAEQHKSKDDALADAASDVQKSA